MPRSIKNYSKPPAEESAWSKALVFIEQYALKYLATPSTMAIAQHLNVSDRRARTILQDLDEKGKIIRDGQSYRLAKIPKV